MLDFCDLNELLVVHLPSIQGGKTEKIGLSTRVYRAGAQDSWRIL